MKRFTDPEWELLRLLSLDVIVTSERGETPGEVIEDDPEEQGQTPEEVINDDDFD